MRGQLCAAAHHSARGRECRSQAPVLHYHRSSGRPQPSLQVDEQGLLANWMIRGKVVPRIGGAMDMIMGAKSVVAAMQHMANGKSEFSASSSLSSPPLTSVRPVELITLGAWRSASRAQIELPVAPVITRQFLITRPRQIADKLSTQSGLHFCPLNFLTPRSCGLVFL